MEPLFFGREPVLWLGLVQTVLAVVLAFGVGLSTVQTGAILAVSAAILAVVSRSQVSPTDHG